MLASAEKVGSVSPYRVLPLVDLAGVATDTAADDPTLQQLQNLGTRVLRAD